MDWDHSGKPPLRTFGGLWLLGAVVRLARFAVGEYSWERAFIRGGSIGEFRTLMLKLEPVLAAMDWTNTAIVFASLLTLVLVAVRLLEARALLSGAALLLAASLGVSFVFALAARRVQSGSPMVFVVIQWIATVLALALVLVALARSVPKIRRLEILLAMGFVLASGCSFALDRYRLTHAAEGGPGAAILAAWCAQFLGRAADIAFGAGVFLGAKWLGAPRAGPEAVAPRTAGGDALRLLGWAILVRVGAGMVGVGTVAMLQGTQHYELAQVALALGGAISLGAACMVGAALIGCLRLPVELRDSGALRVALGCLAFGALLDAYTTYAQFQLLDAVARASEGRELWLIPSLSELESLESATRWCGRISGALGVVGAIAVLTSLATTARSIERTELVDTATTLRGWLAGVGFIAVVAGVVVTNPDTLRALGVAPLLLVASALVGAALVIVANWLSLSFRLGRALDGSAASSHDERHPHAQT